MKMLVHLVNKMSRILQPSIIYIDGGEKPFYKKVPKLERALEPKKMGKALFKQIVKPITPEDRVMVLGISAQPYAGRAAQMKKAFEKVRPTLPTSRQDIQILLGRPIRINI